MPSVEERLASLEGRIQEHAAFMADARGSVPDALRDLRREMDQRFQQIDQRFQQVDQRFQQVDQQFGQVDRRFDRLEARFDRMDRYFMSIMGIMMAGFTAVTAAVVAGVLRLT